MGECGDELVGWRVGNGPIDPAPWFAGNSQTYEAPVARHPLPSLAVRCYYRLLTVYRMLQGRRSRTREVDAVVFTATNGPIDLAYLPGANSAAMGACVTSLGFARCMATKSPTLLQAGVLVSKACTR